MSSDRPLAAVLVRARLVLAAVAPIVPSHASEPPAAVEHNDARDLRRLLRRGDMTTYRDRLRDLALETPSAEIDAELARLAAAYGEVRVIGARRTALAIRAPADSPEASQCIAHASEILDRTWSFQGLLPVGTVVGGTVTVRAGNDPLLIDLSAPPVAPAPTCGPCCHGAADCDQNQ